MDELKSYLKKFIWDGNDILEFEKWLYKQGSIEFEKLVGPEQYMNIIGNDYRRTTIESVKRLIKENLSQELIEEFENYFKRNERMIKGECKKNEALDYSGNEFINWEVEIGKSYDIIMIIENSNSYENHKSFVIYVDKNDFFIPSGFVPMELFNIDQNTVSEYYHKYENEHNEIITEPIAWSKEVYEPSQHSFWEDYYDDDEKAIKVYFSTIDKMGIKNVW